MRGKREVSKRMRKKKLMKSLRRTQLWQILMMVWSVDAVRKGEPEKVGGRLRFPEEAVGGNHQDNHFIAPWTLETLINQALVYPSASKKVQKLDTSSWDTFAHFYNLVNKIENAESLDDIVDVNIVNAMPRIAWRQFGWQVGYRSADRFFRAWWLYNFPEANEYFSREYGLTLERFCFIGFAVASMLTKSPAVFANTSLQQIGVSEAERDAFFQAVSLPSSCARKHARTSLQGKVQIAYMPSVLRRFPLIEIIKNGLPEVFCPLTDLLLLRISDGLFYDLAGDDNVKRLIGDNFESYVCEISAHYLADHYDILSETSYGTKSKQRKTPDLRIVSGGNTIDAVVECRAKRIPFDVRSSPNPYLENEDQFLELVKGVTQIWRYISDVRQRVSDADWEVSDEVVGVVLTLEPWFQMSNGAISEVLEKATKVSKDQYPSIQEIDRIDVAFVSIDDWEDSLHSIDASGFIAALKMNAQPSRFGYLLSGCAAELAIDRDVDVEPYDYHGNLSRVASWCGDLVSGRITNVPTTSVDRSVDG